MATKPRWLAPIAITSSRWLRQELHLVEQHAGYEFGYTGSVPDGRKHARRRPLIIVGADLVGRVRNPIHCGGFVVVAVLDPDDRRTFTHAARINAPYVVALPNARPWLADQLRQIVAG